MYPLVPDSRIFIYGTSDHPSPSHDSSAETVTPKVNLTPSNNPPNYVPNIPDDPDSDSSLSFSSSSDSSDSLDDEYYKQRQRTENNNNKCHSKSCFNDPIKKSVKITAKVLRST